MITQEDRLWSALDKTRGLAPFGFELFDLIASVGLLAKLQAEQFAEIYKSPKSVQSKLLADALVDLEAQIQKDLFAAVAVNQVPAELIQAVVYLVDEVEDFSQLGESLLRWAAESTGRKSGEFAISLSLADLIAAFFAAESPGTVYDGAAGLGRLAAHVPHKDLVLADINRSVWSLGTKLLLLQDIVANYQLRDSLVAKSTSVQADLVVMQPPWSVRLSPPQLKEVAKAPYIVTDKGQRLPTSAGDALWVQLALYNANDSGKVLLVLPPGYLFRGGYDAKCRAYLLEHDLVETVVALPDRLHANTAIPTVLLFLNKAKSKEQTGVVRFVDASHLGAMKKLQRVFSQEDIVEIVDLIKGHRPTSKHYEEVLLPNIHKNNNILNVRHYISEDEEIELPSLEEELVSLQRAQQNSQAANSRLDALLAHPLLKERQE
jgi:type I restriction enzyme M protein